MIDILEVRTGFTVSQFHRMRVSVETAFVCD
jgi:hypothetical protein